MKPSATHWKDVEKAIHVARHDAVAFAGLCFHAPGGRPLRLASVHRELQEFLGSNDRALVELPRDHGKSTQVGIRLVWELGRRPGLRIKIVCATAALAAERGRFIREAIAGNVRVRAVFPHLRPHTPWSDERFTVRRPAQVIGPSVSALGVGVRSTGTRADLLVCDDIVDVTALRSNHERERVKRYYRENLVNLLEPDGRLWYVFTPWHGDDLSAELVRRGIHAHFRRPVGPDLEPVWPEHWPSERLAERRREIGEIAFARAYRLECAGEGDHAIRPEWIQFWTDAIEPTRLILAVDPAATANVHSDRTAIVALGLVGNRVHCLEALARRVSAPDMVHLLDDADRRWQPEGILFEDQGPFAALRSLLQVHTRFGPKLTSVRHAVGKAERVRAFGVHVQSGRFLLQGTPAGNPHPGQRELFDEMTAYPHGRHDDLVDAAAFGSAYLLDRPEPRSW